MTIPTIPDPNAKQSSAGSFARLLIASMLTGFGAVMMFFSATYLQDARLLAEVPEVFWLMICGVPPSEVMAPPLLFSLGAVSVLLACVLLVIGDLKRRFAFAVVVLLSAAAMSGAGYAFGQANRAAQSTPLKIAYMNPPRLMPDFELTNQHGAKTRLSDLRGKYVVLFFGYTHCPDVCPLALGDMRAVKRMLGEDAKDVQFVFISVDGSRDTPAALKQYMDAFDSSFLGLTGPEQEVRLIALEYGARFRANPPNADGFYIVDHTADTYVLDRQGYWVAAWALSTSREDATAALRDLIHKDKHVSR
ncbi:MAG: SCO family protein [Anaerolineae bacterium]|nr:SCO family protein [Thermoflexales bacterium]MDW8395308.1 SCO family protein [Anaerolineae bacterium]